MNAQQLLQILRTRWITVTVTVLAALLVAIAITLATTPVYKASTKLFVSTTSAANATELYEGNRLSQERVFSYVDLLMGRTLAQRTVDSLGLKIAPSELQRKVRATAKPGTVLIDVTVSDTSPAQASYIVNGLSDEFTEMVRELETSKPGARPDARVVVQQRSVPPSKPAVPDPFRNIAAGLALGGLLAVGFAVLRDRLDNTIKDPDTLEQITGVAAIGTVPFDKTLPTTPKISFHTDHSAIAEAFRKLRTNLRFLSVDDPARLILITSAMPKEGKTTTAINIALALAEAEHEVLLVDGDMRHPSVHTFFDVAGSAGFSTALSGAAEIADVLQHTEFPRLTVLTSGEKPPNPSALLGSMSARRLLDELRRRFDYVIVDTAPLLAVSDTVVLAEMADATLIVTKFGDTKCEQVTHAVRTLGGAGASLLGAVLTMTPTSKRAERTHDYYYGGKPGQPSTVP